MWLTWLSWFHVGWWMGQTGQSGGFDLWWETKVPQSFVPNKHRGKGQAVELELPAGVELPPWSSSNKNRLAQLISSCLWAGNVQPIRENRCKPCSNHQVTWHGDDQSDKKRGMDNMEPGLSSWRIRHFCERPKRPLLSRPTGVHRCFRKCLAMYLYVLKATGGTMRRHHWRYIYTVNNGNCWFCYPMHWKSWTLNDIKHVQYIMSTHVSYLCHCFLLECRWASYFVMYSYPIMYLINLSKWLQELHGHQVLRKLQKNQMDLAKQQVRW